MSWRRIDVQTMSCIYRANGQLGGLGGTRYTGGPGGTWGTGSSGRIKGNRGNRGYREGLPVLHHTVKSVIRNLIKTSFSTNLQQISVLLNSVPGKYQTSFTFPENWCCELSTSTPAHLFAIRGRRKRKCFLKIALGTRLVNCHNFVSTGSNFLHPRNWIQLIWPCDDSFSCKYFCV